MSGLSFNNIATATINPLAQAISRLSFGVYNVITKEATKIPRSERYRIYTDANSVAEDCGTNSEAHKAAQTYYAQNPYSTQMMVSTRYETAQPAELLGRLMTEEEAATNLIALNGPLDGSFSYEVNGTRTEVLNLDLTSTTDWDSVAAVLTNAITGATVSWSDLGRSLIVTSDASGSTQTLDFFQSVGTGTDITPYLGLSSGEASAVDGIDPETITNSLGAIFNRAQNLFYSFGFTKEVRDGVIINGQDAVLAAAAWAESSASFGAKMFLTVSNDSSCKRSDVDTDIGSKINLLNVSRTATTFSSYPNQYPEASVASRMGAVDFDQADSTITLAFKNLPLITREELTQSEFLALRAKNVNAFCLFGTDTNLYMDGRMADGSWMDIIHGGDWAADAVQKEIVSLLTSTGKVSQGNRGKNKIALRVHTVLKQASKNGFFQKEATYVDTDTGIEYFLPEGYLLTVDPANEETSSNKTNRISTGYTFIAVVAGAIQAVKVSGSLYN